MSLIKMPNAINLPSCVERVENFSRCVKTNTTVVFSTGFGPSFGNPERQGRMLGVLDCIESDNPQTEKKLSAQMLLKVLRAKLAMKSKNGSNCRFQNLVRSIMPVILCPRSCSLLQAKKDKVDGPTRRAGEPETFSSVRSMKHRKAAKNQAQPPTPTATEPPKPTESASKTPDQSVAGV